MKHLRKLVFVSIAIGLAIGWWLDGAIHAAYGQGTSPPKGLFAEVATSVDGASVRRIRDREEGVICYVATGPQVTGDPYHGMVTAAGRSVAISCVQLVTVNP